MDQNAVLPFQQLLRLVKTLTPAEKARLKLELDKDTGASAGNQKDDFIEFLLNGPVYNEDDLAIIEDNHKTIAAWRTKS